MWPLLAIVTLQTRDGLSMVAATREALTSFGVHGPFRMERVRYLETPAAHPATWAITVQSSDHTPWEASIEDRTGKLISLQSPRGNRSFSQWTTDLVSDPIVQRWATRWRRSGETRYSGRRLSSDGDCYADYTLLIHGLPILFPELTYGYRFRYATTTHQFLSFSSNENLPSVDGTRASISSSEALRIYRDFAVKSNSQRNTGVVAASKGPYKPFYGNPGVPRLGYYQTYSGGQASLMRLVWQIPYTDGQSRQRTPQRMVGPWFVLVSALNGEVLPRW